MTRLLEPLRFRNGIVSPNRIALAALTNSQSHEDGTLSEDERHWLAMRSAGGFGIVTTCAAHVAKHGQGWPGELGIFDDMHLPGLKILAQDTRACGGLPVVQIYHGGLRADRSVSEGRPWSASDGGPDGARAATEEDIHGVIREFADAAARAHAAGMAGIEIHGAHGYLLTQFLSRVENRRDDDWGGSLQNRARLMREVTRAVRARVPASFVVGIRISPEDAGNARGLDLDENLQLARWLCDDGIDFLHISLPDAFKNLQKRPAEHALQAFRAVVPKDIPLFTAGLIWTRQDAERVLDLGAEVIALGRAAIVNPQWPLRIADPNWQPQRLPVTVAQLRSWGLNPVFVNRLRRREGFIAD